MSVWRNVAFPLVEHTDLGPAEREKRIRRVLRMVGLVVRGLRGALEETAAELERGSTLRAEVNGAAAQLGAVVRRLERAQRLCETAERGEGEPG